MLFIEENKIYLTRGDDGVLPVNVSSGGEEYQMGESDVLVMTVRELPSSDSPVLMMCMSTPGINRIIINAADSEKLAPGKYSADIQLTDANGKRHTVWPVPEGRSRYQVRNFENFILMPEVTA